MKKATLSFTDVRTLLKGRTIYVRAGHARFKVTRLSFETTCYNILPKAALWITVEYSDRHVNIENVEQVKKY